MPSELVNRENTVREVRARIERWRRMRSSRGAMPEDLWADAVALCDQLGVYPVAHQLGLSYDRLKLRVVQTQLERLLAENGDRVSTAASDVPVGFVELRSASEHHLDGEECAPRAISEVELARADGARMTLRMADGQALDVMGLSRAFFGAGR